MLFKYIFIIILILKFSKCTKFSELDLLASNCATINKENQQIYDKMIENLKKSTRKLEALYEENLKNFQNISENLENSNRKLEAKVENLNKTVIEENQKVLQRISDLENFTKNLEDKEKHHEKELIAGSRNFLQKISDNQEISSRSLWTKKEHFKKVEEFLKTPLKISDDESVEGFIIKHQLVLHLLMKEMMTRQERFHTIDALKEPTDCSDVFVSGQNESGFYFIYPFKSNKTNQVKVYCDMETDGGGWTVFLQRTNASNPVNFNRNWDTYKKGFGNEEEFWIGNEVIHDMTSNRNYSLRMDLKGSKDEHNWGVWNTFVVHPEDEKFKLVATGYEEKSTSLDYFLLSIYNNQFFSTYDMDNDQDSNDNCAKLNNGGWWYGDCTLIHPTEKYDKSEGLYIAFSSYKSAYATWLQFKIRKLDFQ